MVLALVVVATACAGGDEDTEMPSKPKKDSGHFYDDTPYPSADTNPAPPEETEDTKSAAVDTRVDDTKSTVDSSTLDSGAIVDSTSKDTGIAIDTATSDGALDDGSSDVAPDGDTALPDTSGCTPSPVSSCTTGTVLVGHYTGGERTIAIEPGTKLFTLTLMSYETTNWTLIGATGRILKIQIYSYDPVGTITGNSGIPTTTQVGTGTCDPFKYGSSMSDCASHVGYASCIHAVVTSKVCHMETGLTGACGTPSYSCLLINP